MSESDIPVCCVFVYGTLKRGQCRQQAWPDEPREIQAGSVQGKLWGRADYPALMPGNHRVLGECLCFEPHSMPRVLEILDEIEGTDGNQSTDLYHRHTVPVTLGPGETKVAYVYLYNRDPFADGFDPVPVIDGTQSWPVSRP